MFLAHRCDHPNHTKKWREKIKKNRCDISRRRSVFVMEETRTLVLAQTHTHRLCNNAVNTIFRRAQRTKIEQKERERERRKTERTTPRKKVQQNAIVLIPHWKSDGNVKSVRCARPPLIHTRQLCGTFLHAVRPSTQYCVVFSSSTHNFPYSISKCVKRVTPADTTTKQFVFFSLYFSIAKHSEIRTMHKWLQLQFYLLPWMFLPFDECVYTTIFQSPMWKGERMKSVTYSMLWQIPGARRQHHHHHHR